MSAVDGAVTGADEDEGVVWDDLDGVFSFMLSVFPSISFESTRYEGESVLLLSALGTLLPIPGVVPILSSTGRSFEADLISTRLARVMEAGAGVTWICGTSDADPEAELLVEPRRA